MARSGTTLAIVAVVIAAAAAPSADAGMLVGASQGIIYDIDPTTGLATNPRDTGLSSVAIAHGNGVLYGSPGRSLYTIDVSNGSARFLGELEGIGPPQVSYDLSWDGSTGTLFALVHVGGTTADYLYEVDLPATRVTEIGLLEGNYETIACEAGGTLFGVDPFEDVLAGIDKDGAHTMSTVVLDAEISLGPAMAFDETGVLYLVTRLADDPAVLHIVNPQTGFVTPVGSTGLERVPSLAYVPEPATLIFVVAGILFSRGTRKH